MADSDEDRGNATLHQNQPYDESLEVPDSEEVASTYTPSPRVPFGDRGHSRGNTPPESGMSDNFDDEFDTGQPSPQVNPRQQQQQHEQQQPAYNEDGDEDDSEEGDETDQDDDDEDDDDDDQGVQMEGQTPRAVPSLNRDDLGRSDDDEDGEESDDEEEDDNLGMQAVGAYDPADYEHLAVTPEIKELFQYITRYTPQTIELEHKMKPFIPDYIPAVGDIDAFIKIPRPDLKPDNLGLTVLDEPCAKQSDPTVLDLQLRAISKQTNLKAMVVKSLENAEKNPKAIDSWIESIKELHRSKPPPTVHYTKGNMPEIDALMQEWPAELEELLKEVSLPPADLDCDLGMYVDIICCE
ncbi:intraflagellar transport protein 46 homolog [Lingula anatina]|uniref:Intraflagellar transport protein 46 homolog n=1 Tax=Lingula anatina TaxID=7574 RepID=A0A1S3JYS8_LINAN|nr:intraflagellar transport protein 46 homolog [Lingula anatina]|eukprot:XP_013415548.1 intraflagellar transport protein 46 homolog [Lingula anatina]